MMAYRYLRQAVVQIELNLAREIKPCPELEHYPNCILLESIVDKRLCPQLAECSVTQTVASSDKPAELFLITQQKIGFGATGPIFIALKLQVDACITIKFSKFYKVKTLDFSDQEDEMKRYGYFPPVAGVAQHLYGPNQVISIVKLHCSYSATPLNSTSNCNLAIKKTRHLAHIKN